MPSEAARALATAVDIKAGYFPSHSQTVAWLAKTMAVDAGIQDCVHLDRIELAGLLHDVGKLHVPQSILQAERRLTDDEWELIKCHPRWSAALARTLDDVDGEIASWVYHHHEHYDGSGYPLGLAGEEIPWEARLLHLADAFQVMCSTRSYRPRQMSRTDAYREITRHAGTQFDPGVTGLLLVLDPDHSEPVAAG